jgi:hypothetical protein
MDPSDELRAQHERRRAEQQAESARIAAELKAEKARREAYVESLYSDFLAESVWLSKDQNGHGDPRQIKF